MEKVNTAIVAGESRLKIEELLAAAGERYDRLFLLTDSNTREHCLPLWSGGKAAERCTLITVPAGEEHKNLNSMTHIWQQLGQGGASRHSLLINMGGGVVTDMGGFAAATFKRGIDYVNVPTTLLSMVDAAVGGKTGIDFGGLKNEIGAFHTPTHVLVDTRFLETLDADNFRSGYAEMLKHSLLDGEEHLRSLLAFNLDEPDLAAFQPMVIRSIGVKERVVAQDPHERGLRKSLNLGHTFGHAFESLALSQGRPILHGYAVAYGMVCELYLSHRRCGFALALLRRIQQFIEEQYGRFAFDCKQYEALYTLMTHDKKNRGGAVNFSLLSAPGELQLDQTATRAQIEEVLDFYSNI